MVELNLGGAHRIEVPVFEIRGAEDGPRVTVTAGVHGAEYASIEAALRLARGLGPDDIAGSLTVVPIVNVPGFYARSAYVNPLDNVNLNRVFPGRADGSASERLAWEVFRHWIEPADLYVDLHGGDLVEALEPFGAYHAGSDAPPEVVERSREAAVVFGLPYVIATEMAGLTHAAAAAAGVPAVLAEAGGQGLMPEPDVRRLQEGVLRVLAWAGVLRRAAPPEAPQPALLAGFPWVRSPVQGLFYPAVRVGERVSQGQVVGRLRDAFGDPVADVHAPASGVVMFVVTSLATNPGDPLLAIGIPA